MDNQLAPEQFHVAALSDFKEFVTPGYHIKDFMGFLELPTDIYHSELLMFNYDIDKNTQDYFILLSEVRQWTEHCSVLLSPAVSCSLAPWNTLTSH